MKNLRKLVFLLIALLAVLALVGCGGGDGDNDGDGNGNGNGTTDGDGDSTERAQWAAYKFGMNVEPASGTAGEIQSFTINCVYSEDGEVREFKIEGTYLGTETATVASQKMVATLSPYAMTTENVSASVKCYKVKHHITVVRDETGDTHPDWAEMTLWIPVDKIEVFTYGWISPKATYIDSDGEEGSWSYYLTDAMLTEMQNPPAGKQVAYAPIVEGSFYGYDGWAFFGLYGSGWTMFKPFAEGGAQEFQVGTWGGSYGGYGCTYTGAKVDKTIGGYTLHAWSLKLSCTGQGGSGGYEAIFSDDLALPIYWKIASSGGGSSDYWEYTLTDLELD